MKRKMQAAIESFAEEVTDIVTSGLRTEIEAAFAKPASAQPFGISYRWPMNSSTTVATHGFVTADRYRKPSASAAKPKKKIKKGKR